MFTLDKVLVITKPVINGYNSTCAICRNDIISDCVYCQNCKSFKPCKKVTSDCGHKFHYNCISRWLIGHITCPLCNQEWVNERYI